MASKKSSSYVSGRQGGQKGVGTLKNIPGFSTGQNFPGFYTGQNFPGLSQDPGQNPQLLSGHTSDQQPISAENSAYSQ